MKLEPVNIICPMCGNGNYMRHLSGKGVGLLDVKCLNCNSYFSFEELYKHCIEEEEKMKVKTKCRFSKLCKYPHTEDGECDKFCSFNTREVKTNADRIRAMSDEELAEMLCSGTCKYCHSYDKDCEILEWLRKEAEDGDK